MAENIPLEKQHLDDIFNETGFNSKNLSIRETNRLATIINNKHNIEFVRMEMGIPNIPTSDIAKEAEKEAIDKDENKHIIPTCGSLQGGYISGAGREYDKG